MSYRDIFRRSINKLEPFPVQRRRVHASVLCVIGLALILVFFHFQSDFPIDFYGYPPSRTIARPKQDIGVDTATDGSSSSLHGSHVLPTRQDLRSTLLPVLHALLAKPILSHTKSLAIEIARCPTSHRQSNQDQLNGQGSWWESVPEPELLKAREDVARDVAERFGFALSEDGHELDSEGTGTLSSAEWSGLWGKGGRGLVFTAGKSVEVSPLTRKRGDY